MIYEAILKINPNAKAKVFGDDINTCEIEWLDNTTPISKEQIKIAITELQNEIAQAEQDAINKKASAKQKLIDLGLTTEEIKALIGV